MTITLARPEDLSQIVAFGYASFKENEISKEIKAEPNFEKALIYVTDAITNHLVFVKRNEENQKLIDGVLGLVFQDTWWSERVVLSNFLFYVKPECRTFKVAKDLLQSAKEYSLERSVPIVFDLFAQKDVTKKKRFLKYMKFKELGSFFIFNGES